MGSFTVRAFPKGAVYPMPGGGHRVVIEKIAVYVHDNFNFEGSAPLGWWNCKEKKFFPKEIAIGTYLNNEAFRIFRKNTSHGGNFKVLSNLHLVEDFKEVKYDTDK